MDTSRQILAVSFGSSQRDAREMALGKIEKTLAEAYPEYTVKRAFTSGMVIRIIQKKEGIIVPNPSDALEDAIQRGVSELIIQPTHLMMGLEYEKLKKAAEEKAEQFDTLHLAAPLLVSEEDVKRVIKALRKVTEEYDDGQTGIVFIGHGTEHEANRVYHIMQERLRAEGYDHYLIGTIEASPSMEDVLAACAKRQYRRVILLPFLIVAGDHAVHDIAGEEETSWKSEFEKAGYEVVILKRGLGEYEDIRQIYVDHVKEAGSL